MIMSKSDFDFQLQFVVANAWRLIAMQDKNPLAPSFGCFDYRYWRDKTAEFPDARFQEASLTLALLSMPAFDAHRVSGVLADNEELYRLFRAGLGQWNRTQYPEGSFDEWYKGERGFAATACTTIGFGLAIHFLGDRVAPEDRHLAIETLRRTCEWLLVHDDLVKTNHSAVGAAALAIGHAVTGRKEFLSGARNKALLTLKQQQPEGWFPEIGGMDLGYCSVLIDYIMLYVHFTGDTEPVAAMRKLMAFMAPHIHPDGTIAPEAGSCLNAYVGRVGIGLLSAHDDNAAVLVRLFSRSSPGHGGLLPILADDLRFARWSHLPMVADQLRDKFRQSDAARYPNGWTIHSGCALAAFHEGDLDAYFTVSGGGSVRLFLNGISVIEDLGIYVHHGKDTLVAGYDLTRAIERDGSRFTIQAGLGRAGFMYPGFLSRLILRLGSTTAWGSTLLRRAIDWYRLRAGTALNQSASAVVKGGGNLRYGRSLELDDHAVTITDRLEWHGSGEPQNLDVELRCVSRLPATITRSNDGRTITIVRRFDLDAIRTSLPSEEKEEKHDG